MEKQIFGFIFIYFFAIFCVCYYLYKYSPFIRFITYLANVDLIANVLATNFPEYFKLAYNIEPDSVIGYISYNIISLIALSGIFLYGLQLKLIGYSDIITFRSMIVVSITTYTLPTMLIPYLTKYFKKLSENIALQFINLDNIRHSEKKKVTVLTDETINRISIFISISIALTFIFIEGFIIEHLVHKHNYTANGRRIFGSKHNNPLESLFKNL
jgi:hypothetical protein